VSKPSPALAVLAALAVRRWLFPNPNAAEKDPARECPRLDPRERGGEAIFETLCSMAAALLSRPATAAVMASIQRARSASLSACRQYVLPGDTTRKQKRMAGASSRSGLMVAVSRDTVSLARLTCAYGASTEF
jgi:hypothetical protein